MKKLILSVIVISVAALTACTQKVAVKSALHLYKNSIFSPRIVVATAD